MFFWLCSVKTKSWNKFIVMWFLEYPGLRTNTDRWCQSELIRSLGWGGLLLGTKSHLWITLTDGEDSHRAKKGTVTETKIQFFSEAYLEFGFVTNMIQLLQNLKVCLVINSSYSFYVSPFSHPLGSFASIYIFCFNSWLARIGLLYKMDFLVSVWGY